MIKAIIFDLDGVLVDACDWHYHSLNDALNHHMGYKISYERHIKDFNGLPTSTKLDLLGVPRELKEDIWRMKQDKTLENIKLYGSIDKYKVRMLTKLQSEDFKLCCVTNSIRKTAEEMLKATGQHSFFDFIITNEDVENNKPHPDCYLLVYEKLGLEPFECLVLEDSPKGKKAAHDSQGVVLEVTDPYDVTYDLITRRIKQ